MSSHIEKKNFECFEQELISLALDKSKSRQMSSHIEKKI